MKPLLVFSHIPKNAGTSLLNSIPANIVCRLDNREELSDNHLIAYLGHCAPSLLFHNYLRTLKRKLIFFSILRDPIDRFYSAFNYRPRYSTLFSVDQFVLYLFRSFCLSQILHPSFLSLYRLHESCYPHSVIDRLLSLSLLFPYSPLPLPLPCSRNNITLIHFSPQSFWTDQLLHIHNTYSLDLHLFHMSDLQSLVSFLQDFIPHLNTLGHSNKSLHKKKTNPVFSPRSLELLRYIYSSDIQLLESGIFPFTKSIY